MAEAQSPSPRRHFFDLPFEIRSKIYHLVLDDTPILIHPGQRGDHSTAPIPRRKLNTPSGPEYNRSFASIDATSAAVPPLTTVNQQLRAETAPILAAYASTSRVFNFPSTRALLDVVTRLPPAQQSRIKRARVHDHRALAFTSYPGQHGETHVVAPTVFTLSDALSLCEHMNLQHLLVENAFNLCTPRYEHFGERMLTETLFEAATMVAHLELVSRSALRLRYVQPMARRFGRWRASPHAPTAARSVRVLVRPSELAAPTCFSTLLDYHVSPTAMADMLRADGVDMDWLQPLTPEVARDYKARYALSYVPKAVIVIVNGDGFGAGPEENVDEPPKSLPVPADWSWPEARASEFTIVHDCMDFAHAYRGFLGLRAAREGEESDGSVCSDDGWLEDREAGT